MNAIRPGLGVEFIFYSDFIRDDIRVLRSVIYDVTGDKIILSEPSQGLLKSALNKDVILTYTSREGDQKSRRGFKARIVELLRDYEIASGQRGAAVVVKKMGKPEPYEIRRSYRLPVTSASGLEVHLGARKMNLLDISLGGAKVSHEEMPPLSPGDRTAVRLHIDDRTFHVEAEVIRIWSPGIKGGYENLKFCTLRFVAAGGDVEQVLGKKILEIQRKMIAEGKL